MFADNTAEIIIGAVLIAAVVGVGIWFLIRLFKALGKYNKDQRNR